jgi:hypothetical protein
MLDVKRNRLNYGELISPPEGFELTKAIGTTYTLDLYALVRCFGCYTTEHRESGYILSARKN